MKNTLYLVIAAFIMLSCQARNNAITSKKDYSFLADSLHIDKQLEKYKLPGFSLVVFENYKSQAELAQEYIFSSLDLKNTTMIFHFHILFVYSQ